MMSGASYILKVPSEEQVANRRPKCLGANLTSVILDLESTKSALLTQEEDPVAVFDVPASDD